MKGLLSVAALTLIVAMAASGAPNLKVTNLKSAPAEVFPGDRFTVSFGLLNNGSSAANAPRIAFRFGSNAAFVSASGPYPCTRDGITLFCDGAPLSAGAAVSHTMTLRAVSAGNVSIAVVVDPDRTNATDATSEVFSMRVVVKVRPALSLTVVCPPNEQPLETPYDIVFTMKNTGSVDVRNPLLQVLVFEGDMTLISLNPRGSIPQTTFRSTRPNFRWSNAVTMVPTAEQQLRATMKSHRRASLTVRATVAYDNGSANAQCTYTAAAL